MGFGRLRTLRLALVAVLAAVAIPVSASIPAGADPAPGTVIVRVSEPLGASYAAGFCTPPGEPVLFSFNCSDAGPATTVTSLAGGTVASLTLPAGSYNAALAQLSGAPALGEIGAVVVPSGAMITCSFTMLAAPTCVAGLDPDLATVVVHVDEPAGTFAAGLCRSPATFLGWGTTTCSDGSSNHAQFLNAGTAATLVLPAGTYTGVLGSFATASLGTTGPVTLVAGQSTDCTFTMDAAPACSIDDGDGVDEDPLADGNDDGIPDAEQAWVTTFTPATGGAPVTVVAPDDTHTITAVTSAGLPYTPDPPSGASLPIGVLGFTVTLPGGASTADVDVILPPDTNPTSYFKLQGGAWADFTSHTTIVGDTVTLHLVDGDPFDADGDVNGVIVDPGFPSRGFRFDGFDPPIANHAVNAANAGQSIPVKWRVSRADGSPVSETADIVGLTSNGGPCAGGPVTEVGVSAPGVSGLTYRGNGEWHVNWKTAKAFKGHCRTLSLTLGDGTVHTADFTFK